MSNEATATTDQLTAEEEDRLFDEFAGDDPTDPPEPPRDNTLEDDEDDEGDGHQESEQDDKPRDDQGRFAAQGGEEDETGAKDESQGETPDVELERLRREAQQWQHRYQSDLGRQSALQRKIQQLEQEKQQLERQSAPAPAGKGQGEQDADNPQGSGMSDREWESLKQDFPEIAAGIEQQLAHVTKQYESRIQQLETQLTPIQQQADIQAQVAEENALAGQHPDWRETVQSNDFRAWLQQQPEPVQELTKSSSAADAAYLLTSFKVMTGRNRQAGADQQQRQQNKRRLQSAQTVPSRGGRQRSDIPDDDEDALFDYFAEKADR